MQCQLLTVVVDAETGEVLAEHPTRTIRETLYRLPDLEALSAFDSAMRKFVSRFVPADTSAPVATPPSE